MSLIEIGETGSWLAHFFEKTVGSYAKKPAELYYLSFGFLFGCSVLLQTTPSQFHRTLTNYCPSLPHAGSALWKAAVCHCSLDLVSHVHVPQNSCTNQAFTSGVELYTVSEFSEAISSATISSSAVPGRVVLAFAASAFSSSGTTHFQRP